ncbi:E3 ubiquitin-protein ligase TRIP12, partial [Geosmithia morbida]
ITRSSARQAAKQAANTSASPASASDAAPVSDVLPDPPTVSTPANRKRKAAPAAETDSSSASKSHPGSSGRRPTKRRKTPEASSPSAGPTASTPARSTRKGKGPAVMDSTDDLPGSAAPAPQADQSASSSRKSSRSKKSASRSRDPPQAGTSSTRRPKPQSDPPDPDTAMTDVDEPSDPGPPPAPPTQDPAPEDDSDDDDGGEDEEMRRYEEDEDDFFGGSGGIGLSGTLRALTGMMSGFASRFRDLLSSLRRDDLSVQMIALQELSEILLVSNEDNLSGQFSPDAFVKELVTLMSKGESPEVMLLACRCLANLMEALPASVANVVYGGAVPVLCQKLLEISFIDVAEQSLSTLEKISVEYPGSIVREGGLTACLSYLDFFATSTQRTAVTTAANCCRNIPNDSFPVVRDVMPTLLNVLNSSDQRVVEQASLCVSGIVDCFGYQPKKLEELVSVDLLRTVLRLLVPGTTNLIGSSIHTQFLRVLALTARASPSLSAELFKLNVVETLYQMLTGVSPPSGTEDVASKLDSVVIMQALIHRPREQILETLNIICELLPDLPKSADPASGDFVELHRPAAPTALSAGARAGARRQSSHSGEDREKRVELLDGCQEQVRRFALILFPTLTDAYSSTVNLGVRQRVLKAQLKMLSNLDRQILAESLIPVPYASFLASILSQRDHPSLVMLGLQAAELLLHRLDDIYRYQFYREGVISEITALATEEFPEKPKPAESVDGGKVRPGTAGPAAKDDLAADSDAAGHGDGHEPENDSEDEDEDEDEDDHDHDHEPEDVEGEEDEEEDEDEDHDEEDDDDNGDEEGRHDEVDPETRRDDDGDSPASSGGSTMSLDSPALRYGFDPVPMQFRIRDVARKFVETHDSEERGRDMKKKAAGILDDLSNLAASLDAFYLKRTPGDLSPAKGRELFDKLASYFDSDVLESATSAELLSSGLVRVLLEVLSNPDEELSQQAQSTFLEVFMGHTVRSKPKTATADSPVTPFSVLVHKLQDLLSRSEHFEVITVHQNTFEGSRSSPASMLGKQIRLRLLADESSEIPKPYHNIMVSIHAIATFKSLDEYLRPRISMSERPRGSRRDDLSRALAAMAGAGGLSNAAAARLAERSPFGSGSPAAGGPVPPPPPPQAGSPTGSRPSRRLKTRPSQADPSVEPSREQGTLRRSSRRQAATGDAPLPDHPPPGDGEDDDLQDALECADEKQLTDDEDEDGMADGNSALDAIVGGLHDEMEEDEPAPADPSAVNMEVARGGNVLARKEDGSRVPTPGHTPGRSARPDRTAATPAANSQGAPTPSAPSSKPMSYSSALQSAPQDWHIEFSLDGKVVPNETTIYRAVHNSGATSSDQPRSVWSATHQVTFRRVPGPRPASAQNLSSSFDTDHEAINGVPASLAKNPTTSSILHLLNMLHELNANIDEVLINKREATVDIHREPLSQFVNTKLTAKLNRQLEEPLIVASNCLPGWSEDLGRLYPFLFPFETRHLFLQSTSFGYARSMAKWQNTQNAEDSRRDRFNERPYLGRLQRQKVRISRSKILESALKVMDLYGASQSILEVEYFEEVGTGLGPTLEFYSTVSREFAKKKVRLWRDMDSSSTSEYVSGPMGLFPRPMSEKESSTPNGERILHLFKMLGKFVARSMIDSRIIDIHFNPIFFRLAGEAATTATATASPPSSTNLRPSLASVKMVDPGLASSLMTIQKFVLAKKEIANDANRTPAQKVQDMENITIDGGVTIDDLCLDFTLPGYPEIELEDGGSHKRVTIDNVGSYLDKVVDATLGSGVRRQVDAFRAGFSTVFPYSALSSFTPDELVSLFGKADEDWSLETLLDSIKADHGYNMDSKTPSEEPYTSDDYLPSVMTCVNYLKLPNYSDMDSMTKQMSVAMKEGQGAFHLS